MQQVTSTALEKQIKRHIYGKPQSILIVFPPGMAAAALQEAEYLLSHLWFQNKFESKITVQRMHFVSMIFIYLPYLNCSCAVYASRMSGSSFMKVNHEYDWLCQGNRKH